MVSARRNRVELVCTQVGERMPGPAEGWARCVIYVESVHQRPGEAPVLADAAGRKLTALLPPAAAAALPEDGRWLVEATLVGPATVRLTDDPRRMRSLAGGE